MMMKIHAVAVKMFIRHFRHTDAGIQICDILLFQHPFQCRIHLLSKSSLFLIFPDIDRRLYRPVVSRPLLKCPCIHIPQQLPVFFQHQIWVFRQNMTDPSGELFLRRYFIFECDRCFLHIRRVDLQKSFCIFRLCHPDRQFFFHAIPLLFSNICFILPFHLPICNANPFFSRFFLF